MQASPLSKTGYYLLIYQSLLLAMSKEFSFPVTHIPSLCLGIGHKIEETFLLLVASISHIQIIVSDHIGQHPEPNSTLAPLAKNIWKNYPSN
jgi:hypothetical protein